MDSFLTVLVSARHIDSLACLIEVAKGTTRKGTTSPLCSLKDFSFHHVHDSLAFS